MSTSALDAYLQTRVSIFRSNLIESEEFERRIDVPVEEGLAHLVPSAVDSDSEGGIADPYVVERALYNMLRLELAVLLRPLSGAARDFLFFWAHRFDVLNLKAIIRGRLRDVPQDDIARNLFDMPPFTTLPIEQLLRTENVQELLRQLEGGRYADIAGPARRVFEEKHDLLAVDATLDQRYYAGLHSRTEKLAPRDRTEIVGLVGTRIDHLNLSWIIRYRFAYGLSPSETYYLLIPHGRTLHRDRLLALVEAVECHKLREQLAGSYGEWLCNTEDPLAVENFLDEQMRRAATTVLVNGQSALARAYAYLYLREKDIRRLLAIVRGKHFGLAPAVIRHAVLGAPPTVQ
jgi:V/A-type H+-transporting ATPase subunit C